jgi:hypothetical protein
MRMRFITIYGPSGRTVVFTHYLINSTIFEKKKLLNTKCVFWFYLQLMSEAFLIKRRNERDVIKKMYIGLRVKYWLFLWDFNETWIFWTDFRLKRQISWKSVQSDPSSTMLFGISRMRLRRMSSSSTSPQQPSLDSPQRWRSRRASSVQRSPRDLPTCPSVGNGVKWVNRESEHQPQFST